MQDDSHFSIREDGINQKSHTYPFIYHDRSFVCKSNINQTVFENFMVFATETIAVVFAIKKYVSS